jgi:hypothetical protein
MKYGELTLGQIEAIVNKLGGMDGAQRFLRGDLMVAEPVRCWREEDGAIYFEVTSNGMTGKQWIEWFEQNGIRLTKWAKDVLLSPDFKPTAGVTYKVAVLKGALFTDSNRITSNIRKEAERRKLEEFPAEVACLIRKAFSDEELAAMGLWWIVVFHKPIKDSDGDPNLLAANRDNDGHWLNANYDRPDDNWNSDNGFAFAVSQIASFSLSLLERVFFYKFAVPPAKVSADLIKFFRKQDIFLTVQRLYFPSYHQKYFHCIQLSDCKRNKFLFFFSRQESCSNYRF